MFITRSRRSVNYQVVKILPDYIGQKLLNQTVLSWTSPNHRVIFVRKHKTNRHHSEVVLNIDWTPPLVALMYLLVLKTQHPRYAGSTNIDIKKADIQILILRSEAQSYLSRLHPKSYGMSPNSSFTSLISQENSTLMLIWKWTVDTHSPTLLSSISPNSSLIKLFKISLHLTMQFLI